MYFPYLRGKQFELLALKEMADLLGPQNRTVPIIEPVRTPKGSGLDRCIEALTNAQIDFVLIINPTVGKLRGPTLPTTLHEYISDADPDQRWGLGLIADDNIDVSSLIARYQALFGRKRPLTIIHKGYAHALTSMHSALAPFTRGFEVIHHDLRVPRFEALLARSSRVLLRDPFPSAQRNSDYLPRGESMFTEDHLYYDHEGWSGFSDYATIGEPYSETGFTPRAVAIHWTYESGPDSPIMIRHFTSETDSDTISDVGGKFLEAAAKLVDFLDHRSIHTRASEVIRGHLRNQTYPGLGIVKKLSLQNHLELMSGILSR